MGEVIVKCSNCGREWPDEIRNNGFGKCQCGKTYCAKWREWEYQEREESE